MLRRRTLMSVSNDLSITSSLMAVMVSASTTTTTGGAPASMQQVRFQSSDAEKRKFKALCDEVGRIPTRSRKYDPLHKLVKKARLPIDRDVASQFLTKDEIYEREAAVEMLQHHMDRLKEVQPHLRVKRNKGCATMSAEVQVADCEGSALPNPMRNQKGIQKEPFVRHDSRLPLFYSPEFEQSYYFQEKDIVETSCRGRGPGGQAANRRAQTCVMFHKESGIAVRVGRSPSLWMNRRKARIVLDRKFEEWKLGSESRSAKRALKWALEAAEKRSKLAEEMEAVMERQRRAWWNIEAFHTTSNGNGGVIPLDALSPLIYSRERDEILASVVAQLPSTPKSFDATAILGQDPAPALKPREETLPSTPVVGFLKTLLPDDRTIRKGLSRTTIRDELLTNRFWDFISLIWGEQQEGVQSTTPTTGTGTAPSGVGAYRRTPFSVTKGITDHNMIGAKGQPAAVVSSPSDCGEQQSPDKKPLVRRMLVVPRAPTLMYFLFPIRRLKGCCCEDLAVNEAGLDSSRCCTAVAPPELLRLVAETLKNGEEDAPDDGDDSEVVAENAASDKIVGGQDAPASTEDATPSPPQQQQDATTPPGATSSGNTSPRGGEEEKPKQRQEEEEADELAEVDSSTGQLCNFLRVAEAMAKCSQDEESRRWAAPDGRGGEDNDDETPPKGNAILRQSVQELLPVYLDSFGLRLTTTASEEVPVRAAVLSTPFKDAKKKKKKIIRRIVRKGSASTTTAVAAVESPASNNNSSRCSQLSAEHEAFPSVERTDTTSASNTTTSRAVPINVELDGLRWIECRCHFLLQSERRQATSCCSRKALVSAFSSRGADRLRGDDVAAPTSIPNPLAVSLFGHLLTSLEDVGLVEELRAFITFLRQVVEQEQEGREATAPPTATDSASVDGPSSSTEEVVTAQSHASGRTSPRRSLPQVTSSPSGGWCCGVTSEVLQRRLPPFPPQVAVAILKQYAAMRTEE